MYMTNYFFLLILTNDFKLQNMMIFYRDTLPAYNVFFLLSYKS